MKEIALLVALAGTAHADPDPAATQQAHEANLESDAPRQGTTISAAFGGGLVVGKGDSETVPIASFRLGHVATPKTIVTLEVAGGTFFHSQGNKLFTDSSSTTLVGGLYYVGPSAWIRGAAGVNAHRVESPTPAMSFTHVGPAGAVGGGVDLLRRHLFVVGIEVFGILAINRDGPLVTGGLCLGFSYY